MTRTLHKRAALISILILALLIAAPVGLTAFAVYRQRRQERLNPELIAAVKANDDRAVVSLLHQGADANCRDEPPRKYSLWRTLMQVMRGGKSQVSHALTPLLIALTRRPPYEMQEMKLPLEPENLPMVRALLNRGAKVNITDEDGDAPLILAARNGFLESARLLLDHGAHVNATHCWHTALIEAIRWGGDEDRDHYDICRLLLQRGENPNLQAECDDQTPLMCAVYGQHEYAARLLLQWKADVNVGWKEHTTTALDCAYYHLPDFVPILKAAGAKESR